MPTYLSREVAVDALSEEITQSSRCFPAVAHSLAERIADEYRREVVATAADPGRIFLPKYQWVIRNDDFKVVAIILKVAVASLAVPHDLTLGGILLASQPLYDIYYAILRKAGRLHLDQCAVLVMLKKLGPTTSAELAMSLDMPLDTLETILTSLGTIRCRDGTLMTVASKDAAGLWACAGI